MIKLLLLQLQVTVPVDHQQQLDVVTLELWKDFTVNEVVWYGTKEEWDLVSVGEGEWVGYTCILGMSRH